MEPRRVGSVATLVADPRGNTGSLTRLISQPLVRTSMQRQVEPGHCCPPLLCPVTLSSRLQVLLSSQNCTFSEEPYLKTIKLVALIATPVSTIGGSWLPKDICVLYCDDTGEQWVRGHENRKFSFTGVKSKFIEVQILLGTKIGWQKVQTGKDK